MEDLRPKTLIMHELSVSEILKKVSQTIIDIINDLIDRKFSLAILRGDRLMYIGILILIIAYMVYLVDIF